MRKIASLLVVLSVFVNLFAQEGRKTVDMDLEWRLPDKHYITLYQ